jgi:hypothetical protein
MRIDPALRKRVSRLAADRDRILPR